MIMVIAVALGYFSFDKLYCPARETQIIRQARLAERSATLEESSGSLGKKNQLQLCLSQPAANRTETDILRWYTMTCNG
jgi:hypothetical protein